MLVRLSFVAIATTTLFLAACGSDSSGDGDDGGGRGGAGGDGGNGTGAQSNVEPPDQVGITEAHNVVRASVSPAADPPLSPLVWSDALAVIAKTHADKCIFEHSMGSTGENLYVAVGMEPKPQDVVTAWASETEFYDYASNSCAPNQQCGHYTQIVWRDTAAVGCARVVCNVNSPFEPPFDDDPWINWVCEYDPPGNWVGEKPY